MVRFFPTTLLATLLLSQAVAQVCPAGYSQSTTFSVTGAEQTFVVPAGVTSVYVSCLGGSGAAGTAPGGVTIAPGGAGGKVTGYLSVTPGETLYLYVGGQGAGQNGGYNGGGTGANGPAGGGGGASDIRQGGNQPANRVAVAGGGGGGGAAGCELTTVLGGRGGNGNSAGFAGTDAPTPGASPTGVAGGGYGGTVGAGGAAGIGCGGFLGVAGTVPNGGNGQSCCCFSVGRLPGGGGGGGGYVQGGGGGGGSAGTTGCSGNDKGGGGGGAGGSHFTGGLMYASTVDSANVGDGSVTICYCMAAAQPTLSADPTICQGETTTLSVTGGSLNDAQNWTWYDANNAVVGTGSSISVSPSASTTYTVRGEGGCSGGPSAQVAVTVNQAGQVAIQAPAAICEGTTTTITASGSSQYSWNTGASTAAITVGPGTYSAYGVDANGCKDTNSVTIASNPLPQPVIVQNMLNLSTSDPFASYQWYFEGNLIQGANGQVYTPTQNGAYTVVVVGSNGCEGTSASFTVTNVSADLPFGWTFNVFPNPTVANIEIEINQPRLMVSLTDVAGHTLNRIILSEGVNSIDLSHLPAGNYILTFDHEGKRIARLITKQ